MGFAQFVRQAARIAISAFAATSAGVIASSLVPFLLLQLPPWQLMSAPKPLLVFSLTCVMLFGIPIFLIASSQRRVGLGIGSYIGYSVAMSMLVMLLSVFALVRINSWAKFYDAMWILLTEAIPGGVVAGMVAYMAMNVDFKHEEKPARPAPPAGLAEPASRQGGDPT